MVLIKHDGGPQWSPDSRGGTSEGVPVTFSALSFLLPVCQVEAAPDEGVQWHPGKGSPQG